MKREEKLLKLLHVATELTGNFEEAVALIRSRDNVKKERFLKIFDVVEDFFEGDYKKIVCWLTKNNRALGGLTPMDCLDTDESMQQVLNLIGQLTHGITS